MADNNPMQSRTAILAAYAGTGDDLIKMNVWLDIRDLLNRISMVASVSKPVIIEDSEVNKMVGQMKLDLEGKDG